jgi:acyl dehydratase
MVQKFSLSFRSVPAIVPSYARIVFGRKAALLTDGAVLPPLEAVAQFTPKPQRVAAYRAVCGDGGPADVLPMAYPHVIATPVQLALMSSRAFPVRLMGLVHLRNHIELHRPIGVSEAGRIRVWIDGYRETSPGQEFDVNSSVEIDGKPVWQETCVFMARRVTPDRTKRHSGRITAGEGIPAPDAEAIQPNGAGDIHTSTFEADDGVGWRYAKVAGDFNPIHLWKIGARMFGFNQPIAHGMWSMARALATLEPHTFAGPKRVDVVFKRPVTIPAPLTLETWHTPLGSGFALKGTGKGKTHVAGSITPLASSRS